MEDEQQSYADNLESQQSINILSLNFIKIQEKFILELKKDSLKKIDKESKKCCKILKFPSDWNLEDIYNKLKKLNHKEFLNLFIFVIETSSNDTKKTEKCLKYLNKFSNDRPLVLQITSVDENVTKIFYKEENSRKFHEMMKIEEIFTKTADVDEFEKVMLNKLPMIENSSLIIRFLRTFELSDDFFIKLILKCAECGSKSDLLASIDASFGNLIDIEAQQYLSNVIINESSLNDQDPVDSSDPNININSTDKSGCDEDTKSENSSTSSISHLNPSILHEAIKNSNKEVINFLISYCCHFIEQLPFKHKVRISTTAFNTNQIDELCDLIEISDFPFPDKMDEEDAECHERLNKIINVRSKFSQAIKTENFDKISKFIQNNPNLRLAYNSDNESALKHAINLKKYKIYFHLKSLGFQASEFFNLDEILSEMELKKVTKIKLQQRRSNVVNSIKSDHNPVMLLSTKSSIHNRKIRKELEQEYHTKIINWYEDIQKIEFGPELLVVAASCEQLRIIYDFESFSVENASLDGPYSAGSTYPISKWIFIGSKLIDESYENEIKGVIAHELCHYIMRLVFENDENPYYKHKLDVAQQFEEITKNINKWSSGDSEDVDDECCGIISSVFKSYSEEEFHLELIVRVVQIQAQFADDKDKLKDIQDKYKELFEFFRHHVLPELRGFNLRSREDVRKQNRIFELFEDVNNRKIEILESKIIDQMLGTRLTFVMTNLPMLLLIDIHKNLQATFGDLFDTKNIFIDPEKLKNSEILNDLKAVLLKYPNLNVFIDCSKDLEVDLINFISQNSNFIFITSNESQSVKIQEKIIGRAAELTINYNWNDLTLKSQKFLIKSKIIFQNSINFTFYDLLRSEQEESEVLASFADIVDDQLLNLLLNNHQISINTKLDGENPDNNFDILFHPRQFSKEKSYGVPRISQQQLIQEVKKQKYVLISDIAGSGKSWVMKNLSKMLREQYPSKWVTYVDLKLFLNDFKTVEFSEFMVNTILCPKFKFLGNFFAKLYSIGKVIILFDAFDEIAPDCAEIVSKLALSFEINDGNQLWIATRDYFEVNLQNMLKIDTAYKLYEFTEEDGIQLISKMWLLNDIKDKSLIKSENDFYKFKNQLNNYEIIARRMIEKVSILYSRSIGLPQLFKMIADAFINDRNVEIESKKSKIYEKFAHNLYERWSFEKGLLRKKASIESQSKVMNFWSFHQFSALKSYFLKITEDFDEYSWTDEEIIACGIMSKKGGKLFFLHETFREFFAADFIAKNLMMSKVDERFLELFTVIITDETMEVIQMFLNDIIDDFEKLVPKMKDFIKNFYKMNNFHEFFTKNLENLACFVIDVLKNGSYEEVKIILFKSALQITSDTKNPKLFQIFKNFMLNFLNKNDIKDLVIKEGILQGLIGSSLDIKIFKEFINELNLKIDKSSISEALKSISKHKCNIFPSLCWSSNFNDNKVHEFLKIMTEYLNSTEILELMKKCNNDGKSILHICIRTKNIEKFKIFWYEIESQQSVKSFKELIMQKNSTRRNILHYSVECDKLEFHEEFWKILIKFFKNREELKNFVLETDKRRNNFVHDLIENSRNPDVIESIFNIFRDNFNETEFQEIFKPKGRFQRNLLQTAAFGSNGIEILKILWKIFRNVNKSDKEFLDVLKEVDDTGEDLILNTVKCSSCDVLEFLIVELEKVASNDEIRELLSKVDRYRQNLLQAAVWRNKSWKLHIILWTTFKKYFNVMEMKQFVSHVNNYGSNLLSYAVRFNTLEFTELTWNEIKSCLTHDEVIEYLKVKRYDGTNLVERSLDNKGNPGVHEWVKKLMVEYGVDD